MYNVFLNSLLNVKLVQLWKFKWATSSLIDKENKFATNKCTQALFLISSLENILNLPSENS